MSSQSSYVYNEHPDGLGRISIREADPMSYDDRRILQPVDSYSAGDSTVVKTPTVNQPVLQPEPIKKPAPVISKTSKMIVQPIIATISKPQTGRSKSKDNPETGTSSEPSGVNITSDPIVKVEGDQLVINGNHRIGKKKAALVGGGLIGAAVLLKLVL